MNVFSLKSQTEKVKLTLYEGIAVAGYVDQGAFLNFTGPNISIAVRKTKIMLGMLPSLRFKQDLSAIKNAFVTPNLGAGLTVTYKFLALQVPMYYNAKTSSKNGSWHIGVGVGLKLNDLKRKN